MGKLPKAVVQERYQRLIDLQEKISLDENTAQIGRTVELLVATGEGRKDASTARMSGRARDGRLVHFNPAGLDIRPGDIVTATVTGAAPHHLIADGAAHTHRRTRAGDAHAAGQKPRTGVGASQPATLGVGLGMPGIGVAAQQPDLVRVRPVSAGDQNNGGFEEFKGDIEAAERRVAGEIDPGARALVIAIAVFVLLVTFVLPHTGNAKGLDVLLGDNAAIRNGVALPSRVFTWLALVFSVGFSMLALLTRRWALAWIALAGSTVASFTGLLAVWSRQTAPAHHPGPGIGLIIAWLAVIVLAFNWARAVWARTALQLAAEEQRRRLTAERQNKGLLDSFPDKTDDTGDDATGPKKP